MTASTTNNSLGSKWARKKELKRNENIWEPLTIVQNILVNNPALSGQANTQFERYFPYEIHMIAAPIPCVKEHKITETDTNEGDTP